MKYSDPRHPCNTFIFLNETERSNKNLLDVDYDQQILCDRTLRRHWYRFGTGSGRLPETCPSELSCGTHSPIYLDAAGVGEDAIFISGLSFYKALKRKDARVYSSHLFVFQVKKQIFVRGSIRRIG